MAGRGRAGHQGGPTLGSAFLEEETPELSLSASLSVCRVSDHRGEDPFSGGVRPLEPQGINLLFKRPGLRPLVQQPELSRTVAVPPLCFLAAALTFTRMVLATWFSQLPQGAQAGTVSVIYLERLQSTWDGSTHVSELKL